MNREPQDIELTPDQQAAYERALGSTRHLSVLGRAACNAPDGIVIGHADLHKVDCEPCKKSIYGQAAERMLDEAGHYSALQTLTRLRRLGIPRIEGALGKDVEVPAGIPVSLRLRMRHTTMTDAEKHESFFRITEMCADTCPGCGGSIADGHHDQSCRGADPEKWELTDAEVTAELEVAGIDPRKSRDRLNALIDSIIAKNGE